MADLPKKSTRRFSKWMVGGNVVLIWGAIYLSVIYGQAAEIVPSSMALIGTLFGFYTGIGHLDMRKAVELSVDHFLNKDKDQNDAG